MKQGPFTPAGLCCPGPRPLIRPPPTPSRPPVPSRAPGYRQARSRTPQARGRVGPLQFPRRPSDRSTPPTPEGPSVPAPSSQVPSLAFADTASGSAPSCPLSGKITTLQASRNVADRPVASTPLRRRPLNQPRGLHYRGPWHLPGPDSHRLAIVNLSLGYVMRSSPLTRRPSYWTHSRSFASGILVPPPQLLPTPSGAGVVCGIRTAQPPTSSSRHAPSQSRPSGTGTRLSRARDCRPG